MVLHILLLLILPYLLLFLIISTFKVADLHGVFVGGYGTKGSYSSYTGSAIGTPQTDTLASHSHTISPPDANYQYGNNSGSYGETTGSKSI